MSVHHIGIGAVRVGVEVAGSIDLGVTTDTALWGSTGRANAKLSADDARKIAADLLNAAEALDPTPPTPEALTAFRLRELHNAGHVYLREFGHLSQGYPEHDDLVSAVISAKEELEGHPEKTQESGSARTARKDANVSGEIRPPEWERIVRLAKHQGRQEWADELKAVVRAARERGDTRSANEIIPDWLVFRSQFAHEEDEVSGP